MLQTVQSMNQNLTSNNGFLFIPSCIDTACRVSGNMNHIVCVTSLVFAQTVLEYLCHDLAHAWEQDSPQQANSFSLGCLRIRTFLAAYESGELFTVLYGEPPKKQRKIPCFISSMWMAFPPQFDSRVVLSNLFCSMQIYSEIPGCYSTLSLKVKSDQTLLNGPKSKP